jgi:hypothetical protein
LFVRQLVSSGSLFRPAACSSGSLFVRQLVRPAACSSGSLFVRQLVRPAACSFGGTLATAVLQPFDSAALPSAALTLSVLSATQPTYDTTAEVFLQVPAASLPPIVATAASQLFVSAAPSATLQLSVLSNGRKLDLFAAASPANLVSSSAAVALQSVGRFQLTATGKHLVDLGQPLMCVQHISALCGKHSAALRFLLFAQLQCSCRVQPFDTAASSVLDGTLVTAIVRPMFETYAEAFLQVPGSTVGSLAVRSLADGSLAVASLPDATNLVGPCGRTGGDEPSSLAYVNFGVSTAIRHETSLQGNFQIASMDLDAAATGHSARGAMSGAPIALGPTPMCTFADSNCWGISLVPLTSKPASSTCSFSLVGDITALIPSVGVATSSPLVSAYDPAAMSLALATPVTASMGKAHTTVEAFFETNSVSVGVPPSPALPVAVGVVTSSPLASDPVRASSGKPSASVGVPPASALPKSEFATHVAAIPNDDKFSELKWISCFYDRS